MADAFRLRLAEKLGLPIEELNKLSVNQLRRRLRAVEERVAAAEASPEPAHAPQPEWRPAPIAAFALGVLAGALASTIARAVVGG